MSKNISNQIVEFLIKIGVKYVYGVSGNAIDSVMESFTRSKFAVGLPSLQMPVVWAKP